jgi:hypothetical protein
MLWLAGFVPEFYYVSPSCDDIIRLRNWVLTAFVPLFAESGFQLIN